MESGCCVRSAVEGGRLQSWWSKLLDQLLQALDRVRPGMVTGLHSALTLLQGKRTQAVRGAPVKVGWLPSLGAEGALHVSVPCQRRGAGRVLQVCRAGLGVRLSHSEPLS